MTFPNLNIAKNEPFFRSSKNYSSVSERYFRLESLFCLVKLYSSSIFAQLYRFIINSLKMQYNFKSSVKQSTISKVYTKIAQYTCIVYD